VFRRRNKGRPDVETDSTVDADGIAADAVEEAEGRPSALVRPDGPYDVDNVPADGLVRLDLGGLRVPGTDGMELRLELDESGENVQAVTVVQADSTLQLMAFAAPRTEGIWDDVREEIRKSLASQGLVDQVEGAFGTELHATLTIATPQGTTAMQPVRFVGIDGPRWFVRGLFAGAASREGEAAASLEAVLRATVVVRGTDPMAPGDALPLHVPGEVPEVMAAHEDDEDEAAPERPPLTIPQRGPEITEIR
jgi:hypothetical protein